MTFIKFKPSIKLGPVTIGDGKRRPKSLYKSTDGQALSGGDLVAGRVYEIDIETGEVRWPPRTRKARRKG